MSCQHISIAGKGGTGKTTLSSLIIRYLIETEQTPVLAVDADPNANLAEALGLQTSGTIVDILSRLKEKGAVPQSMSKDMFVEYQLSAALTEAKGTDLLCMGGPEGTGCYCYPNDILKRYIAKLAANYKWLVMDNEAGMEHLSRRVATDIDVLLIISDATVRGIKSARRIADLTKSLSLDIKKMHLIVNRVLEQQVDQLDEVVAATGLDLLGYIPADPVIGEYDLAGRPIADIPKDCSVYQTLSELMAKVLD